MPLIDTLRFITNHPLNRDQKLKSLVRFAKWQIGGRLVPKGMVIDWVNGSRFLVRPGEAGLTGNIYTGLHEFADMGFLLHFLRREDHFVDIGANLGSYTILACAAVGAGGIAVEPIPDTFHRLVENVRLNHLDDKVQCINQGVSDRQGSLTFTGDRDATNHALAPGERHEHTVDIEMTTLDHLLENETPTVIKIDVEGYETLVLEGAQATLQKPSLQAVIIELNASGNRYDFDESKIPELMGDYGFKPCAYNPVDRTLSRLEGKNPDTENTLFIRHRPFVEERIKEAPMVSVYGKRF